MGSTDNTLAMNTNTPEPSPNVETPTSETRKRKGYRLYKRRDDGTEMKEGEPGYRERHYYFRFEYRGKRYPRCLETNDAEKAQARAKKIAAEIKAAVQADDMKRLDGTRLRQPVTATVGELITSYLTSAGDADPGTRQQNVNALKQILGICYTGDVTALSVAQINTTAARRWFEHATEKAAAEKDQSAQLSLKRSANSRFVQARSLFTPRAIASYKDAGVYHENLEQFHKAYDVFSFTRLPLSTYNPPAETIVEATLDAWEKIDDRDLFLAIGHELAFGLRVSEMAQAKWNWWKQREGYPVLDGTAIVKNGSGLLQVRALDPWFTVMRIKAESRGWRPTDPAKLDSYILTGSDTNRNDSVPRAVSAWLRNLGWDTQKTNHALRAYAGSQIAMKYGIYEAQTWLRHSSVNVTERNYSYFVKRFKPADPDTLPIRWATAVTDAPQLRIVNG